MRNFVIRALMCNLCASVAHSLYSVVCNHCAVELVSLVFFSAIRCGMPASVLSHVLGLLATRLSRLSRKIQW